MKKRVLVLLMSLFMLAPAVLGSAWAVQNPSPSGIAGECEFKGTKTTQKVVAKDVSQKDNAAALPEQPAR